MSATSKRSRIVPSLRDPRAIDLEERQRPFLFRHFAETLQFALLGNLAVVELEFHQLRAAEFVNNPRQIAVMHQLAVIDDKHARAKRSTSRM